MSVNHFLVENDLDCIILPTGVRATTNIGVEVFLQGENYTYIRVYAKADGTPWVYYSFPIHEIGVLSTFGTVETDLPVRSVVCSGKVNLTTKNTILTQVMVYKGEVSAWIDYRNTILLASSQMTSFQRNDFLKFTTVKVGRNFSDFIIDDKKIVTLQDLAGEILSLAEKLVTDV